MIAGGHRRIAHIAGWTGASTGRDRRDGFLSGLAAAGIDPVAVLDGNFRREDAIKAASAMFEDGAHPDAIFVGNDHMACAVMDELRGSLGLRVPEDVSVVGYDDVPLAAWGAYELTTWRQPSNRMVEATVDLLLGQIDDPNRRSEKREISGHLIVRSSARVPEGWEDQV